jgi:hypothetical protein
MMIHLALLLLPITAFAAQKPSMGVLWWELGFMLAMIIVVKISAFTNQQKGILFGTYILLDIITQTLWVPIIVFIGIYIYLQKNSDEY